MPPENNNNSLLRLLLIEDSPDDAELLLRELRRGGFLPDFRRVENAEQMRAALEAGPWDIVIADYTMPNFSATGALRVLRGMGLDLPFIIVSGTIGEATAVAAMKAGAHDYLTKDDLARLVPAVRREMRDVAVRRARNAAEEHIKYMAHHDPLTNLPNRLMFFERLKQAMFEADRHGRQVGVLLLDLDRFKTINDTRGHDVGDLFLRAVAARLQACMRRGDTVARFGGDEFVMVLADLGDAGDAVHVAKKILECFREPFNINDTDQFMTASLGISHYPLDDKDIHGLLRKADVAMYRAKDSGRNSYQMYAAEMSTRAAEFLELENDLRHALEHREFYLEYQPIADCATGRILGMEALLRWRNPKHGLIPPGRFIPFAEEIGMIIPIGEWVLRTACQQCRHFRVAGQPPLRLSVNLSARQFHQRDLAESIEQILYETGFDRERLDLEITEGVILQQQESTISTMRALKEMGINLSLDDFGIGYSSLSYLKRFPIDTIKIDQSFVHDIPADPDDAAIAVAIITMAHSLGLKVVAEGVETAEQLKFMRDHGCDAMQGYLRSQPLPAEQLEGFLKTAGPFP